jgi:hypothetical protein
MKLATREYEVVERILRDEEWMRCQHGKRVVEAMVHWSDEAPFTVTRGRPNSTQRFTRWLHADGSEGNVHEYNVVTRCAKCGALDSLTTELQSYGDLVCCTACNAEWYYSIGD